MSDPMPDAASSPAPAPVAEAPSAGAPALGLPVPWVTIALAVLNVAAFAWELAEGAHAFAPTAAWMAEHGGNVGVLTLAGEPWRLLTSMFLHYGVLHLAMNLIGLVDGGRHVERMYGRLGFAALYLVSGLAGGLASAVRGGAVSAGASGAVFGVFGAFGAFLFVHRDRLDRALVSKQARGLGVFVGYNVLIGVSAQGIDLAAHLGGLAAGAACGLALEVGTTHAPRAVRRALLVGVLGVAAVGGAAAVLAPPANPFADFADREAALLERWRGLVAQAQEGTVTDAQLADAIERELLPGWREVRAKLEPEATGDLGAKLRRYLAAREDGWVIMVRGLRASDQAEVERGVTRWAEGDAIARELTE